MFSIMEAMLQEKLKEQEKESLFSLNFQLKQAHLMGYRKALRDLLMLKPDNGEKK